MVKDTGFSNATFWKQVLGRLSGSHWFTVGCKDRYYEAELSGVISVPISSRCGLNSGAGNWFGIEMRCEADREKRGEVSVQ